MFGKIACIFKRGPTRTYKCMTEQTSQRLNIDLFPCLRGSMLVTCKQPKEGCPNKATAIQMDPSGKSKGPPPAVKKVLSLFGSGKEEDRMVGYLSFLKIGPKLLKFLPGRALHKHSPFPTIPVALVFSDRPLSLYLRLRKVLLQHS